MKGDKVVEVLEIDTDGLLFFFLLWHSNTNVKKIVC